MPRPDLEAQGIGASGFYRLAAVSALLLAMVALAFAQAARHRFVNIDDNECVYQNKEITDGLSWHGTEAAFTKVLANNWVPLTYISHMLDWQVYKDHAGGHHVTNLVLHAATVVILFLVLVQMTGRMWASAAAAALFAIHPLRAESVAWVTERKDVLSGLFFVLALWAYVGYARHPFSLLRYSAVMAFLALGLMAKPMLVTFPLLLLLLDYWPLGRINDTKPPPVAPRGAAAGRRVGLDVPGGFQVPLRVLLEKVPLLAIVAASSWMTLWAQGEALVSNEVLPPGQRLGYSLVSYVTYLGRLVYPADFAVLYPRPDPHAPVVLNAALALIVLAGITAIAVLWRRRSPYLLVGWLWYLGMLFPVSGIFGFGYGAQWTANRFTYLPQIGLGVAAVWGLADLCRAWPRWRWACGAAAALAIAALASDAWYQVSYWSDSETLWTRAIDCTPPNALAHYNLARDLLDRKQVDRAVAELQTAAEIRPNIAQIRYELGGALVQERRHAEAVPEYLAAIQILPVYSEAYNGLGVALHALGRDEQAIECYRKALDLGGDSAVVRLNLGVALKACRRFTEALDQYERSLKLRPSAEAHSNLGNVLVELGRSKDAIQHYRQAVEINPNRPEIYVNWAMVLANHGQPEQAIELLRRAAAVKPDFAPAYFELGNLLRTQRSYREAVEAYRKCLAVQPDNARAQNNLGNVLVDCGLLDEAIDAFRKALSVWPDYTEARVNLDEALRRKSAGR